MGTDETKATIGLCGDPEQYSLQPICPPPEVDPEPETTTAPPPIETTTTGTEPTLIGTKNGGGGGGDDTTTTVAPPSVPKQAGGGGDPHFKRWNQKHDSFHGECDLVMIHSLNFHQGTGFDMHVRTTIEDYFSYIETAAIKIGDWTLEFVKDKIYVNGVVLLPHDLPYTFGDNFKYTITNEPIPQNKNAKFYQYYGINLNEDSQVLVKFYKDYLTFEMHGHFNDFADSVGLLGQYETGLMYSRDGLPLDDFKVNAFEWQVSPEDPTLFQDLRSPQLPYEPCRLPTMARPTRRHLRADKVLLASAEEACSHVAGDDFHLCVEDIMTTQDLDFANTW
jgi:hypothetical protein